MKIKCLEDYIDEMVESYPEFTKKEMEKILTRGMQSYYRLNSRGADTYVSDGKYFVTYCGKMFNDVGKQIEYHLIKMRVKLRLK